MRSLAAHPCPRPPSARRTVAEALEPRTFFSAALVRDVNTAPADSNPTEFTDVGGGVVFFAATDPDAGTELWKTDGATGDTVRVKDLVPGPGSSLPQRLTAVGDALYFFARDSGARISLWTSDGTDSGTVRIRTFSNSAPPVAAAMGDVLYFVMTESGNTRLCKSNGTSAGTVSLPAGGTSTTELQVVGNTLYFPSSGSGGIELWKTDGTDAGTVRVKDILPGTGGSVPQSLTAVGSTLFFTAQGSGTDRELWNSDGTDAGTVRVKDINPGGAGSNPTQLVNADDTLFFAATDASGEQELWTSDGTADGTVRVIDLAGTASSSPTHLTVVGGPVYFAATHQGDTELWSSEGTADTTVRVADVRPGPFSSSPADLTNVGGRLFFTADGADGARELWLSDDEGTRLVEDIAPGVASSSPRALAAAGAKLFFAASGPGGVEPWVSDGTSHGTFEVADLSAGTAGSSPQNLTRVGNTTYFTTTLQDVGHELWKSDGTPSGTTRVKAFILGPATHISPLRELTVLNGLLYFSASDGENGPELWRSDGTEAGTYMVKDIRPNMYTGSEPQGLTVFDGKLFFSATHPNVAFGRALWTSDGTEAGTVMVNEALGDLRPEHLKVVGGVLYFSGFTIATGKELWRSDGSAGGTFMVKDIKPGGSSSEPMNLTDVDGTLYFSADPDNTVFRALFHSDGTADNTVRATDIVEEYAWAIGRAGDTVLFVGLNGNLYKTDGTPAGTSVLLQLYSGWSSPIEMLTVGDLLYVAMHTNSGRSALWRIDGTPEGSYLLKEFNEGYARTGIHPLGLVVANGRLLFNAPDAPASRELWTSDGTVAGTVLFEDVYPGPVGSDPTSLTPAGGSLWFAGEWPGAGRELLRLDLPNVPAVVARHVFYNDSAFDGSDPLAGPADDGAIATGKAALLPGELASFSNITTYTRGLNGIMFDVAGHLPLTALAGIAGSVELKAGAGSDPSKWVDAPRPTQIGIRPGAGVDGSDRVTLVWNDGALRNTWLRVTVRALRQSGLSADDTFTFGNLAGEIGEPALTPAAWTVTAVDANSTRAASSRRAAPVDSPADHNRDGVVNVLDYTAARANVGASLARPTTIPAALPPPPVTPAAQPTRRAAPPRRSILADPPAQPTVLPQ